MIKLYGIKNCDTVKKAIKWLNENNQTFEFHDYRVEGLSEELLENFAQQIDWSLLLNKRSTTFRNLPDEIKNNLSVEVMRKAILEQPTLLKRPILANGDEYTIGFKAPQYQAFFE